jgi:hypothetical protein
LMQLEHLFKRCWLNFAKMFIKSFIMAEHLRITKGKELVFRTSGWRYRYGRLSGFQEAQTGRSWWCGQCTQCEHHDCSSTSPILYRHPTAPQNRPSRLHPGYLVCHMCLAPWWQDSVSAVQLPQYLAWCRVHGTQPVKNAMNAFGLTWNATTPVSSPVDILLLLGTLESPSPTPSTAFMTEVPYQLGGKVVQRLASQRNVRRFHGRQMLATLRMLCQALCKRDPFNMLHKFRSC